MIAECLRSKHLPQLNDVRVLQLLPYVNQGHTLGVDQTKPYNQCIVDHHEGSVGENYISNKIIAMEFHGR